MKKFQTLGSGMPDLEENVLRLALLYRVMMVNGDNTSLLKDLMLIRAHCRLLFTAKTLTNTFHLVKDLPIMHGFLDKEQD